MSGFLYYFPLDRPSPLDHGLTHLKDVPMDRREARGGPNGQPGIVSVVTGKDTQIGYYPDQQVWEEADGFWIGYHKDNPPKPEDLQRKDMLSGYDVTMGDGHQWSVPVCRMLPRSIKLINGEIVRGVTKQFKDLEALVNQCFDDYCNDVNEKPSESHLTEVQQIELIVGFLEINYTVGICEINTLCLLNDLNKIKSLEAIMDIPSLIDMTNEDKKKVTD